MWPSKTALAALVFALSAACSAAVTEGGEETGAQGERECFECEVQRTCVAQSCAQTVSACWGASYFAGENGGACAEVLDCMETCPCADDACEMSCFADASVECLSCTTQVRQCEQSMCAAESSCPGTD